MNKMNDINCLLQKKLIQFPFLITAHRGFSSGNIIENTSQAMIAAFQSGADITEINVIQSEDGHFYVFHDGNENRLLHEDKNIKKLSSIEIDRLFYRNTIGHKVQCKVEKLEKLLAQVPAKQLINIDRSWDYWNRLLPLLDRLSKPQQILLKSPAKIKYLNSLAQHPVKYMFFPIVKSLEDLKLIEEFESSINIVGVELIAPTEDHALFQIDLIGQLRNKYLFVFANSIVLDDETVLFSKLDDDTSILRGPEYGWGKVAEKGCNVIQTDWPNLLRDYRRSLTT